MIAIENQSLIDICIKQCGTVEALLVFASGNGIGSTTAIVAGQELKAVQYSPVKNIYEPPVLPLPAPRRYTPVSEGQSLIDVALQECGSLEGIIPFVLENHIALDSELSAGQLIFSTSSMESDKPVASYLRERKIRINTGTQYSEPPVPEQKFKDWLASDFNKQDFL